MPTKPGVATCQKCHKGYYTGWDYSGRAPREDNMRYQRGLAVNGETFLKMLPDVHYQAGMTCGACHSMSSLIQGKKSSKACVTATSRISRSWNTGFQPTWSGWSAMPAIRPGGHRSTALFSCVFAIQR